MNPNDENGGGKTTTPKQDSTYLMEDIGCIITIINRNANGRLIHEWTVDDIVDWLWLIDTQRLFMRTFILQWKMWKEHIIYPKIMLTVYGDQFLNETTVKKCINLKHLSSDFKLT